MLNIRLAPSDNLVNRCDYEDARCDLIRSWCDYCGAQVCGNHFQAVVAPSNIESDQFTIYTALKACPKCFDGLQKTFDVTAATEELNTFKVSSK